jgi:hypothetical protein
VNLLNQFLVNAVIFLVGLALFGLTSELGIALGLAIAIVVRRRRRSAPPGEIQ